MEPVNNRALLMKRLQVCDFMLMEANLYLDTHPNDETAIAFWNKYRALRDQAMCDYTEKFGPVVLPVRVDTETWSWVDSPWPWEGMEE